MIKIDGLKKNYKKFSLDCSLELQPGRITGLIGRNGAGKSTAFKAVLGLISIDSGSVQIFGKDIREITSKDREKIGIVLSDSGFSGYLKIPDIANILSGFYGKFDKAKFLENTERFELPRDKQIKEFSTGMKAKLKILAAVSHGAELLILDEPSSGLDVIARDEILTMIREYMEEDEKRSVLISSHISSDLETLTDDIYMIEGGKIVLHEDTDRILGEYAVLKLDLEQFDKIDKSYLLYTKKESFGYSCLTDQKRFYMENYPDFCIEKAAIDSVIELIIKGEEQ